MARFIGELLVAAGVASEADVQAGLRRQGASPRRRLGELLVEDGVVTQAQVAQALASQAELPFLERIELGTGVSGHLSLEFQQRHALVAFRMEKGGPLEQLHVAVADPRRSAEALEELAFQLGKPLKVFVASRAAVDEALSELATDDLEEIVPLEELEEESPRAAPPAVPAQAAALPAEWDPLADLDPPSTPAPAPAPTAATAPAPARPGPAFGPSAAAMVVPVVRFEPGPRAPRNALAGRLDFSEDDLRALEGLERMVRLQDRLPESEKVTAQMMVAGLVRLLVRKGVIEESELFEELARS